MKRRFSWRKEEISGKQGELSRKRIIEDERSVWDERVFRIGRNFAGGKSLWLIG